MTSNYFDGEGELQLPLQGVVTSVGETSFSADLREADGLIAIHGRRFDIAEVAEDQQRLVKSGATFGLVHLAEGIRLRF